MIAFYNKFPSKLTYVCLKLYFEVKITAHNTDKKEKIKLKKSVHKWRTMFFWIK